MRYKISNTLTADERQLTIHKYADSRAFIHVSYTSFVFLSFQVAWIVSIPATREQHEIWLDAVGIMENYQ